MQHMLCLSLKKKITTSRCCLEGPISTTVTSEPSHSSPWHLRRVHLSGSCSLSQHATCHLKIRDNYTVHTTGYWASFYDPQRTIFVYSVFLFEQLLISHHLSNDMFTLINGHFNTRIDLEFRRRLKHHPNNVFTASWAQIVSSVKDSISFHCWSRPHWALGALLFHSQHRGFTSHLLWNKPPSVPLATGAVHYRGVRLHGERAHNLFDTFLCGCNCISHFPVVSSLENAKALPIKPRATLFCSTFSHSPSSSLSSFPSLLSLFCPSCWLKLVSNAWTRGIQTNSVTAHSLLHPKAFLHSRCFPRRMLSVSEIFVSR